MKQLLHIGNTELISLPDDRIKAVLAKIDTGADGSAIWASNIHFEGGQLKFNFFAPGSTFYKPKPVTTTAFKVTTIKNSFGHKEFRYKIRLKVQIGDHQITRWFSLADRSQNTYPVLLGRNILKGRFIVDVSKKFLVSKSNYSNKVLVLGAHPEKMAEFFERAGRLSQKSVTYVCSAYDSFIYYMDNVSPKIINTEDEDTDVATYALTYFKSHLRNSEFAAAIAQYLQFKARPFLDHEPAAYVSGSKLTEYMKLGCYGLPVPKTVCARTPLLKERFAYLKDTLGLPFVLKEITSDRGKNNYFITSQKDFKSIINKAPEEYTFLAQQYIENDGFFRIYVLGKEAHLAIWRSTYPHKDQLKKHLNKPAGSKNATKVSVSHIPGSVHNLAIQAADYLDRQVAGVDLIQDKHTKKWYILEVNNSPQLLTGSFADDKAEIIANFFDKEINQ